MEGDRGSGWAWALTPVPAAPQGPWDLSGEGVEAAGLVEPGGAVANAQTTSYGSEGEGAGGVGPRQALRAVYVHHQCSQSGEAHGQEGVLQYLHRACEAEGARLFSVPFEELDFGKTSALDTFYCAGKGRLPDFLSPPPHKLSRPSSHAQKREPLALGRPRDWLEGEPRLRALFQKIE